MHSSVARKPNDESTYCSAMDLIQFGRCNSIRGQIESWLWFLILRSGPPRDMHLGPKCISLWRQTEALVRPDLMKTSLRLVTCQSELFVVAATGGPLEQPLPSDPPWSMNRQLAPKTSPLSSTKVSLYPFIERRTMRPREAQVAQTRYTCSIVFVGYLLRPSGVRKRWWRR